MNRNSYWQKKDTFLLLFLLNYEIETQIDDTA